MVCRICPSTTRFSISKGSRRHAARLSKKHFFLEKVKSCALEIYDSCVGVDPAGDGGRRGDVRSYLDNVLV
jgi:hypothetical protein